MVKPTNGRTTWDDVVKIGEALGLMTPAGSLGKKLLKTFLTRYIPALTEGALAEWAMPVASGVAFTAVVVEAWAARTHNAQTKQAFRVDKQRRDYDRTVANAIVAR